MNVRALSTGSVLALVAAGLLVSGQASAAPATCQGQPVTISATEPEQDLEGTDGPDVISAVGFAYVVVDAKGGDDLVCGGLRSFLRGGPGADTFVDGGHTTVSYPEALEGVRIDLSAGTAVDGDQTDTLVGIHYVQGSPYADTVVGSPVADYYQSSVTVVAGGQDGDHVEMGAGLDYVSASGGVVDLGPGDDAATVLGGIVRGGTGDDDLALTMRGVARGGPGDDTLAAAVDTINSGAIRSDDRFTLVGGPGRDVIRQPITIGANKAGCPAVCARADIDGGTGRDTLALGWIRGVVDLAAGRSRNADSRAGLRSIEDVLGSRHSDVIRGDAGRNHLAGELGNDVLVGRGGRDTAVGGPGRDRCFAEVRRSC